LTVPPSADHDRFTLDAVATGGGCPACAEGVSKEDGVSQTNGESPVQPPEVDWEEVESTEEFRQLRRGRRNFVLPMAVLFLVWYLLYVFLADYAHSFMAYKLLGNINVGLVLGLLQFVSTFVITGLYVRFADRKLDPVADRIRERIEGTGK
jgi:uncharacterized membrane protein (DUF485 family)